VHAHWFARKRKIAGLTYVRVKNMIRTDFGNLTNRWRQLYGSR
jgi:hypothetical protein